MEYRDRRRRYGFTLIELMLVIGIIAILATVVSLSLFNFRAEQGLNDDVSLIVGTLRDAQQRSITQENDGQWGVRFDGVNGYYDLFQYPYTVPASRRPLSPGVQFSDPSGTTKDIVFSQRYGCRYNSAGSPPDYCFTASDSVSIRRPGGVPKPITVNANGTVSY